MQSWALGFFCAVALLAMVASSQNGSAIALNPNEQRNMEQGEKGGGSKGQVEPHLTLGLTILCSWLGEDYLVLNPSPCLTYCLS